MANRYFTVLVVPEKTSRVRRVVIPAWLLRTALIGLFFLAAIAGIMLADYWYVMGQIGENKDLKTENRRLVQQVQIYRNKVSAIESTMDRIQTFATRLRVITNIEERDSLVKLLNQPLPDAATNIGQAPPREEPSLADALDDRDPEKGVLTRLQSGIENDLTDLNDGSLVLEQSLQDLYELLADQRDFLSATPTRRPARGNYTSGFGIRKNPYGAIKMHEGIDIANHQGTEILAPASAVVSFSGVKPGYGRTLILDHGYGLESWYGHTRKLLVQAGEKIRRGQVIAEMGSTGRSTGSHLHYEVRINGIPVDPISYILEN